VAAESDVNNLAMYQFRWVYNDGNANHFIFPDTGGLSAANPAGDRGLFRNDVNGSLYIHWQHGVPADNAFLSAIGPTGTPQLGAQVFHRMSNGDAEYMQHLVLASGYAGNLALESYQQGDSARRWTKDHNGLMSWGTGGAALDTFLARVNANSVTGASGGVLRVSGGPFQPLAGLVMPEYTPSSSSDAAFPGLGMMVCDETYLYRRSAATGQWTRMAWVAF
jgi:hypothetical protein